MRLRHAKHSFDARRVSDSDLNVRFRVERRSRIEFAAFDKDAADGIEKISLRLIDRVQMLNDRAIQIAAKRISVCRQRLTRFRQRRGEGFVGASNHIDADETHEIEAVAQIDNRADDRGTLDLRALAFHQLLCEIEAALRIGFPEIDPRPQPIVVVFTGLEEVARKQAISDGLIATVIAKNKACG